MISVNSETNDGKRAAPGVIVLLAPALTAVAVMPRPHEMRAPSWPPWVVMWSLALLIWAACKALTLARTKLPFTKRARPAAITRRVAGYVTLWPGMDADTFLNLARLPSKPAATEWRAALSKTVFGALLLWVVMRRVFPVSPIVAGWLGLIGLCACLHFGAFHLLSIAWRRAGVAAEPLMRQPLRAKSVAEFWGRRWNHDYHHLAHRYVFVPLLKTVGKAPAFWLTFFISGLLHDLVISVPAQGGYGRPTLYFLLQACGITFERGRAAGCLGLPGGIRGTLFTIICTAAPAGLLFHPPFVLRVMVPFFAAIGAL
jgi:hypothetical protein